MDFLCIDVLNSDRVDWKDATSRRDLLEDPEWMSEMAKKWEVAVSEPIDPDSLDRLKGLRAHMYSLLSSERKESALSRKHLSEINEILESACIHRRMHVESGSFRLEHKPDVAGWDLFTWRVADSFANLMCQHDETRVKICENDNCGWVFFDNSKNKSRRWCDNKACGNIMKVRAFRARQKAEKGCVDERRRNR